MRKLLILVMVGLLFYACSGTGHEATNASFPLAPNGEAETAEIVVRSILARAVPASVTSLRFTATDADGNRVFGPETRAKAAVIRLVVPITAKNLQIEYLEGDTVVGLFNQELDLSAGETFTINDPDFVDVNVVTLESITIDPSSPSLAIGASQAFTAIGNFSNDTSEQLGAGVTWSSSDPNVASINASGQATAVGGGTTTITATFQGVSSDTTLTVIAQPAPVPIATSLVFTGQPVNNQATLPMAPVVVEVRDQDNAVFTGASVPVTLALGPGSPAGTLGGTLTVDTTNGMAVFNDLTISAGGDGFTLVASSAGLTGATSNSFDLRPAPGSAVVFDVPTANSLPSGICAGPDGNLWFTESAGFQVGRITPAGVITEFSAGLSLPIELLGICSVPAQSLVYFTERNMGFNGRIGFTNTAGPSLGISQETVLFNGGLPAGICLGPDGNVWFTLSSNSPDGPAIGRMIPPDVNLFQITSGFSPNPTFTDICAGPDGNLWVVENANAQLAIVNPNNTPDPIVVGELPTGLNPTTIVSGPDGRLWYCRDGVNDAVEAMTTAGTVTTIDLPQDSDPRDLCVGPDGNVWVTLRSFDGVSATSGLLRITPAGAMTVFQEPTLIGPVGICSGPDGNLWVTCSLGNAIARVTP